MVILDDESCCKFHFEVCIVYWPKMLNKARVSSVVRKNSLYMSGTCNELLPLIYTKNVCATEDISHGNVPYY